MYCICRIFFFIFLVCPSSASDSSSRLGLYTNQGPSSWSDTVSPPSRMLWLPFSPYIRVSISLGWLGIGKIHPCYVEYKITMFSADGSPLNFWIAAASANAAEVEWWVQKTTLIPSHFVLSNLYPNKSLSYRKTGSCVTPTLKTIGHCLFLNFSMRV